jgi:predicted DNA-binding transcriptional regulator AlpA
MPHTPPNLPFRFLTVRDLCEITGRGRSSIYRDVHSGNLPPPVRLGGSPRWRSDHLEAFFDGKHGGTQT